MRTSNPFDGGRDDELGAAIREVFTGPAPERFLARMRGALAALPRRQSEWDVLAAWAGPRVLAAAAVIGFMLGLSLWRGWQERMVAPAEAATSVAAAVLEPTPADDAIIYAAMEGR